jgi:hypothetical protein
MNSQPLKQADLQTIQSFAQSVAFGGYRMFSAANQLPSGIPCAGPTCVAVVIAASAFNADNLPGDLTKMMPSGNVYLWRSYRAHTDSPPHWNADDSLCFTDDKGNPWNIHSKSAPDHFKLIVSRSGLS